MVEHLADTFQARSRHEAMNYVQALLLARYLCLPPRSPSRDNAVVKILSGLLYTCDSFTPYYAFPVPTLTSPGSFGVHVTASRAHIVYVDVVYCASGEKSLLVVSTHSSSHFFRWLT